MLYMIILADLWSRKTVCDNSVQSESVDFMCGICRGVYLLFRITSKRNYYQLKALGGRFAWACVGWWIVE